jgi:teichuronic acid biosynthesis glycosyltransferase TuaH
LDQFLGKTNVRWLGEVPSTEVPPLLGRASVGITPYARTQFNNASFPLKTLEYLAAGLPAVANPSSAVQWLDTALIKVGKTDQEFVEHVVSLAQQQLGEQERAQNRAFARTQTWEARAGHLLEIADSCAHEQQFNGCPVN